MSDQGTTADDGVRREKWQGSWWVVGLVVLASLGLAGLLIQPIGDLILRTALGNFAAFSVPEDATAGESASVYAFQILAVMGLIGLVLAFVGAILSAISHERPGGDRKDYVGKLFGVAAGVFALTGGVGALDAALREGLMWAAVGALVLVVIALIILGVSRRSRAASAAPMAGGTERV